RRDAGAHLSRRRLFRPLGGATAKLPRCAHATGTGRLTGQQQGGLNMPDVNWIAVLLCAVSSLVLGGIWYSPMLFAKPWQRAAGLSDEAAKSGNMGLIFGLTFVLSLIAAYVFAMFLGRNFGLGP